MSCHFYFPTCISTLNDLPFPAMPLARNVIPSPTQSFLEVLSTSRVTHRRETLPGVLRYPCAPQPKCTLQWCCSHCAVTFLHCHSHDPLSSLGARGTCSHLLCVLSTTAGSQEKFRSVCSKKDQRNQAENPESTLFSMLCLSPARPSTRGLHGGLLGVTAREARFEELWG